MIHHYNSGKVKYGWPWPVVLIEQPDYKKDDLE